MNSAQQIGYGYMFWWAVDAIAGRPKHKYFVRGTVYGIDEHCQRLKDACTLMSEEAPNIAKERGIDMELYNKEREKMLLLQGVMNFDEKKMDEYFPGWRDKDNTEQRFPLGWMIAQTSMAYLEFYQRFGKGFLQGEDSYDYYNLDTLLKQNGYSDVIKVAEDYVLGNNSSTWVNGKEVTGPSLKIYAIMKRVAIEELYEKGDYYVNKYLKQMQEAKTSFDVFIVETAAFAEWIKYRFEKLKIDKDLWYPTYKRWRELAFLKIDNPPSPVRDLGAGQHKTTLNKIAKKFKVMI